jgi:hypothetical protein
MNKSIRTEIIINASKEKVWNILSNFSAYPGWNPFIIHIAGEQSKGSRLAVTLLNGKKEFAMKPRVVSVVPNQYFDWLGSLFIKGLFDGHHYFEIEEVSPTQVRFIHGEHFSGILSGMILRSIADETRNNFIKMNNALKERAEQN